METPAEERIDGGGAKACSLRALLAAGTGNLAGCDTKANCCACSEKYESTGVVAGFCGWIWQHKLFGFIADGLQACAMLWQHACCPIGCIARRHADTGIAIHRTVIASINHAPRLLLSTCIV
ncbi:MAG: hypothetical protein ACYCSP_14635 [Acidobacteriaceae bacterium]